VTFFIRETCRDQHTQRLYWDQLLGNAIISNPVFMKRLFFACFIVLLFAAEVMPQSSSITVNGYVSGLWDVDTVRVTDDIAVAEGDSLIILPGVLVEFRGSYSFYIRGYVHALGSTSAPVVFDVADTLGFSVDTLPQGGWNGIHFYYNAGLPDSSLFEHCVFRHGKAVSPDTLENYGGAVSIRYSDKIRFSHCQFINNFAAYNGGALYAEVSTFQIDNCLFSENRCGPPDFPWGYGGAVCADQSEVKIINNIFTGNSSTGVGGAVAIRFRDAMVSNNIFTYNHSALGGAIGYLHYYQYAHSQCNNLIYGNTAEFFGGGIASLDAGPTFVNNTITQNASVYGGGFYVKDSLIPNLYNTILWDNNAAVGPEVYLWDAFASANFYYCDVAGGPELFGGSGGGAGYGGEYLENIDEDPLFADAANLDFHLSPSSPCINAGTPDTSGLGLPAWDLDGMPRIDHYHQIIDMGCYEHIEVGQTEQSANTREETPIAFPNPFRENVRIDLVIPRGGQCRVMVYDMFGKHVATLSKAGISAGPLSLWWDGTGHGGTQVAVGSYIAIPFLDGQTMRPVSLLKAGR
jgi:predicted outer membrane repeat protein